MGSAMLRHCALALLSAMVLPGTVHAASVLYQIDPDHTYPSFEADHMGMSVWRGKFTSTKGEVRLDKAAQQGSVDVKTDADSIDFGLRVMNNVARGPEIMDSDQFAKVSYRGELTNWVDGAPTRVQGELTLHGVTRAVPLTILSFKCMPHPLFKRDWCGADAVGSIDRAAFGIDTGKAYGFRMEVQLRIQVEALAAP
jgi:polyisoprenoid-binding protein YceI